MKKAFFLFVIISSSFFLKTEASEINGNKINNTKKSNAITNITTAQLRALGAGDVKENSYIITDDGKEGSYWKKRVVQGSSTSLDNRGTILVTSDFWIYDQIFTGPINVKWFGVKGDGATDDIITINNAARAAETARCDLIFPAGSYIVSSTFLPPKNVWCYGVGQFSSITASTSLIAQSQIPIVLCDDDAQSQYKIRDIQINGVSATSGGNSLIGLQVGSSRNSIFTNIVIQNCWFRGLLIQGKSISGEDIENPVFSLLYTARCGGILLKTDGTLTRGNITNASFRDCNITTDANPTYTTPRTPIEIIGSTGKFIYGVNFLDCFTQPRNAPVIKMTGNGGTVINNNFKNITSDYWGQTSLADISETINAIILDGISKNGFERIVIPAKTAGIQLINSSYNTFSHFAFDTYTSASNSRFFDIDVNSLENIIDSPVMPQANYFEKVGGPFANSQNTLFGQNDYADGKKIIFKDLSYSTIISNSVFKNGLELANSPSKLFAVTGSLLTNYVGTFNRKGVTCNLSGAKLQVVFPSGTAGVQFFDIPITTTVKYGSLRIRYRFLTTGFSGTISAALYGFNKALIADGNTHEITFITDTQYQNYPYYGLLLTGTLDRQVTLEIEKWEIYEGYNLPYIPNYVATEQK